MMTLHERLALVLAVIAFTLVHHATVAGLDVELFGDTAFSNRRSLEGGWLLAHAMLLLRVVGGLKERTVSQSLKINQRREHQRIPTRLRLLMIAILSENLGSALRRSTLRPAI